MHGGHLHARVGCSLTTQSRKAFKDCNHRISESQSKAIRLQCLRTHGGAPPFSRKLQGSIFIYMVSSEMNPQRRQFLARASIAAAAWFHPRVGISFAEAIEHFDDVQDAPPDSRGTNRFLSGNFAPVSKEIRARNLPVVGKIPEPLRGTLVRNGPNPQFQPLGKYHWFDGDGMLHAVSFSDSGVHYQNRYIATEGFLKEKKVGRSLYRGLLEPPDIAMALAGLNPYKNSANTSVVYHGNRLLALWEAGSPYELRIDDLETLGKMDFAGKVTHPFTAHPKIDPKTGEMLTFGYLPNEPFLMMSQIDASGTWLRTSKIPVSHPTMVHDFAITERFAVFPLCPLRFDVSRLLRGSVPWHFNQSVPTQFAVVSRSDPSQVQLFEADTCFVFHLLNAFEKSVKPSDGETTRNGQIELVGCRYEQFPGSLNFGDADDASASDQAIPYRWILDLDSGRVREEKLDEVTAEFPRINEAYTGSPNRYGFFGLGDDEFFHGFKKMDLASGRSMTIEMAPGYHCGEGIFTADRNGDGEDAGWLLSFVYVAETKRSELWVLDAKSFDPEPVAKVILPERVPYGFHGTWIPKA